MQWILDNWLLLLLVGGMGVMHLGHGKHGKKTKPAAVKSDDAAADPVTGDDAEESSGHGCCGGKK